MLAFGYDRFFEFPLTYSTTVWKATILTSSAMDLVITFCVTTGAATSFSILEPPLFLLQLGLVLLFKLVATFVVTPVMDENTCVTITTIAMLVVIFAALWIVINPGNTFRVCWC